MELNEFHPDFGRILCRRRGTWLYWIMAVFMFPLGLLATVLGTVGLFAGGGAVTLVIIAPGACILWIALTAIMRAITTITFYEHAAVRRRFGRELIIKYMEVASLSFGTQEQKTKGAYVGTLIEIALEDARGQRIQFVGSQRERVSGMFFWRNVESIDELESVKDIVSENIADAWEVRVLNGEEVAWCGEVLISADGLTRFRRNKKGKLTPWSQIVRSTYDHYWHFFHRRGDKEAFIQIARNKSNFLPGLSLIHRRRRATARPSLQDSQPLI